MQLLVESNIYTFILLRDTFFDWCNLYSGATFSPKTTSKYKDLPIKHEQGD